MALKDNPGVAIWAISPDGKESQFGLYVYTPRDAGQFEYPQIGLAVIKKVPDGDWVPWMAEKSKASSRYNPRVFCYLDAIPSLMRALDALRRKHLPGTKSLDDANAQVRRELDKVRSEEDLDSEVRKFHEFG